MESFFENFPDTVFVTGTGTDVGKSFATGWMAKRLLEKGEKVITQKLVQTGNKTESEDIELHRRIMGIPMTPHDKLHVTAPIIFTYPCSPHLAARLDGRELDLKMADEATDVLTKSYDKVLIEGAGGVMVPLHECYLTLDFIIDRKLPAIVVVGGELGSINHALLTLELMRLKGVEIYGVVYNPWFDKDKTIASETRDYLHRWTEDFLSGTKFVVMPRFA